MTIKNKGMFFRGILFILLGIAVGMIRLLIFSQKVHGVLKPIMVAGACLFIGIAHVILSFQNDSEDNEAKGEK